MTFFEKLKTLLSTLFFQSDQNSTQPRSLRSESDAATETIFVKFAPNTTEAERAAAITTQLNGSVYRWLPEINTCIVHIPVNGDVRSTPQSMPAITAPITRVEPDGVAEGCQTTASPPFNDPRLPEAYGLRLIEAIDAWQFTTGQGVLVAVLDTGIDENHPEFSGRLLPGQGFVEDGDGTAADDNGHGTHIAGIIGAALNNNQGAVGIAPNCTILPIKVLDSQNIGAWSGITMGLLSALGQNAQVINMSFGADARPPQALEEAIQLASQSAVLVAAAGNALSQEEFFPAAYPEVIGVSATTETEELWGFSNTGPWVTVAAPGDRILSTGINNSYELRSGTSMSAGFVAGLAALLIAQDNQLTPTAVTEQISTTAISLTDPSIPSGQIGSGRINAFGAVGGKRVFIPIVQT